MRLVVEKAKRTLALWDGEAKVFQCAAALGKRPVGQKEKEGDGKTPEGAFYLCLVKEKGKYGRSLGLSYPDAAAAERGLQAGLIDREAHRAILAACRERRRPPWGTALGGEIYIHEGGAARDWTQGCIALDKEAMDVVFPHASEIEQIIVLP